MTPRNRARLTRLAAATTGLATATLLTGLLVGSSAGAAPDAKHHVHVLRVGTWHGIAGQYHSVQKAVRAAHRGDWVLVGPGDYKEHGYRGAPEPAGVLITVDRLHLRGMNRNSVVIDGTKRGTPKCSAKKSAQIFTKDGRDGVQVLKANGTYIENLTVCNYLTGNNGGEGNEIWWNGGDGSGKIGMHSFWGNYLTGTSTYSKGTHNPRGEYGIFTSNTNGPGVIAHTYASNMGDAAYYIGACPNCHQTLRYAHGEFSALGYSGTNSGGYLVIAHSEFDHNKNGATSNSQNNDDAPSPENGACPGGKKGPLGLGICTIWRHNYFHDNNNPDVPGVGDGLAGASPIGSGLVLAGTHNYAVYKNRFVHNKSWGVVVTDLPDQETPPSDINQHCQGGTNVPGGGGQPPTCYFDAFGEAVIHNTFRNNSSYGNPGNADIAFFAKGPDTPGNCQHGNTDPAGLTVAPAALKTSEFTTCGGTNSSPDPVLGAELECATELLATCPGVPGATHYPRPTKVRLHMPPRQKTMPHPCKGVPANPWCPHSGTRAYTTAASPARSVGGADAGIGSVLPIAAGVTAAAGGALWVLSRRRSSATAPVPIARRG